MPVGRSYPRAATIKRCAEAGRTYETTTTSETDAGRNAIFETKPRNYPYQQPLLTDVTSPALRMDSTCSKQHIMWMHGRYTIPTVNLSQSNVNQSTTILLIFRPIGMKVRETVMHPSRWSQPET